MSGLPASWLAITLGEVIDYANNTTVQSKDMEPSALLVELEDIERDTSKLIDRKTVAARNPKSSKNRFLEGQILYGKLRPYLNKIIRADQDGYCSSEIIAISPGMLDRDYLFYYLKSPSFLEHVNEVSHGMGMPRLGTQQAKSAPFVLAPLGEQTRIAQKLDALLAQVDNLKARINAIPALLKRFRQSVLTAAVSGRLTEEWRKQNSSLDSAELVDWRQTIFGEICREITVGYVGKMADQYKESGIPFLRSQNVRPLSFAPENILYISEEFHTRIIKSRLEPGDLAIVRSGAPGVTCVIPESLPVSNCSDLVIARPSKKLIPWFGCIYMNSEIAQRNVADNQVGVAQQHFNVGSMKKMPINLPPIDEQTEIVRRVEQLFAFADQLEAKIASAKKHMDHLTQSILAKAFRGELVPQVPNDEPASALLERIQAQRAAASKVTRGRKASA
ncbi:restriction endonuclease subunit S [Pseudomonas koreensis]